MAIKTTEAKQLCTKSEFELYLSSLPRAVAKLKASELKRKLTRARRTRDKYRDLANQQKRQARGKQASSGKKITSGNKRTRRKEKLFAESLGRFEKQLTKLERDAKKTTTRKSASRKVATGAGTQKKKSKKSSGPTKRKTSKKRPTAKKGKRSAKRRKIALVTGTSVSVKKNTKKQPSATNTTRAKSAASAAKSSRKTQSGIVRKQKHVSSQSKRNQARRDHR